MAYDSSVCSSYLPSMDWDLHSFGAHKADMSLAMAFPYSSDLSTGYLEDAIADWSHRCKRQRTLSYSYDQMAEDSKNNQNLDAHGDHFMSLSDLRKDNHMVAGPEPHENICSSSTCSFPLEPVTKSPNEKDSSGSKGDCGTKKVVYPFDLVKPGGTKGEVTLDDINERMLMRPTKPVRHPVGEFASHTCVSETGFGRSGKAVVALTKIYTRGRGTITIIRTRG